jgi:2-haloacid dehalogenase
MPFRACVFDAYGTLFDVNAAARRAASEPGAESWAPLWPKLAQDWRLKQLQYTWLRAVARRHCDFWQVTQDGLDWALEAAGLSDLALRERLLALFWALDAFPEVEEVLSAIKARGIKTAILSNGSPEMLAAAVQSATLEAHIDEVLSVEDVQVFKPHDTVYDLVGAQLNVPKDEVLFVSSNGWDAAGAAGYGFRTVWVNRAGEPQDRLYATPDDTLPDLRGLLQIIA